MAALLGIVIVVAAISMNPARACEQTESLIRSVGLMLHVKAIEVPINGIPVTFDSSDSNKVCYKVTVTPWLINTWLIIII